MRIITGYDGFEERRPIQGIKFMVSKQTGKETGLRAAVEAFYSVAKGITKREITPEMRGELNKIAQFLRPDNADAVADMLELVAEHSAPGSFGGAPSAPVRVKPVQWEKNKKGKDSSWQATWEGYRLFVVRKKTGDQGVVFDGLIDDKPVTRGKLLTQVQTEVAAEAYRRFVAR